MLINLLINLILIIFASLFQILPEVRLPTFIADPLEFMMGIYVSLMDTIPYLRVTMAIFLLLVAFEIALLVAKFFLGHRLPTNHN